MNAWHLFAVLVGLLGYACLMCELYWTSLYGLNIIPFIANSNRTASTQESAQIDLRRLPADYTGRGDDVSTSGYEDAMAEVVPEGVTRKEKLKTILLWNSWYQWQDYQFGLGRTPFIEHCQVDTCRTTINKSELSRTEAVVVFGRLLPYNSDQILPKRAFPQQLYIYANLESPSITFGKTKRLGDNINLTMTYRRDSDVRWSEYDIIPTNSDAHREDIGLGNKTHLVAWMISHCNKQGNIRMEYARKLSSYVQVDIYGRCGNFTCDRGLMEECMDMLEKKYSFYLSFENSICTDYLTEKVYRTLQYNLVPIVMGGANYSQFLPPHSYINVEDYQSPKELAEYLEYLHGNPEEYSKYFEWKKCFGVRKVPSSEAFCSLCSFLNSGEHTGSHVDIGTWWDGDHCEFNVTSMRNKFNLRN